MGDYDKGAYLPFSAGARGCIGRRCVIKFRSPPQSTHRNHFLRFSETEQIAILSVIVLHYKITVLEEPQYAHETAEEQKTRVLQRHRPFLVQPVRVPLVFTPRDGADIQSY